VKVMHSNHLKVVPSKAIKGFSIYLLFEPVSCCRTGLLPALKGKAFRRKKVKSPIASKRLAEMGDFETPLKEYVRLEYVGKIIAGYLERGYIPMTF